MLLSKHPGHKPMLCLTKISVPTCAVSPKGSRREPYLPSPWHVALSVTWVHSQYWLTAIGKKYSVLVYRENLHQYLGSFPNLLLILKNALTSLVEDLQNSFLSSSQVCKG